MVEPGKKPSRGRPSICGGSAMGREKSAAHRQDAQIGKARGDARLRAAQRRVRDVDRHIGIEIAQLGEQQLGLEARAGAELDEHAARSGGRGDIAGALAQDAGLGARQVVFGQRRDVLEQLAARGVVEEAAGDRLARRREPGEERVPEIAIEARRRWQQWRPGGCVRGCSCRVLRKAQAGELPALMRVEEIAVGGADVPAGRRAAAAAQDLLAHHELAVVLADGAGGRAVAGIGLVGAGGPLPHVAEELREPAAGAGRAGRGRSALVARSLPSSG